ncbi:hypothetical protein DM02DRAFT_653077 [Periconia macrospinosa]|uniref:EthD domain-containing protein n=1 Tax=Periconia macrospinosa TaxID=97972 RepID=A0A2V1E1A2_9PLEO|nr:hypothetical protein DM02DRAFT_653077 [Periconia macrospinosa]
MSSSPTTPGLIITLLVKRKPNLTFNETYLHETHIPLVEKHWGPHGLINRTAARVLDETSEYAYSITMTWDSEEAWMKAAQDEEGMRSVREDVGGVTDGEVILIIGKVL